METKINPKSYIFIKYLLTLGLVLLYLVGFTALIVSIMLKDNNSDKWVVLNYYKLTGSFLGVGLISLSAYICCRLYLHKKSCYKLLAKERTKIYLSIFFFSLLLSIIIFLICARGLSVSVFFYSAIVFLIVLILLGAFISIFEELSLAREKNEVIQAWNLANQNEQNPNEPQTPIINKKQDKQNPFLEE